MRILTRYLLRSHLGPFLFSLVLMSSLLLINTVARRLEDLVGKGLPWAVMGEFLLLSMPHIIALTLPMAVLVAVLYTFSQLTADNEVTALKASGINLLRMLLPLLGAAVLLAVFMVWFNDSVLPESNHRLKNLISDVARKSPTFQLKEQVVNEIQTGDNTGRYFLQAGTITPGTNALRDVVIYDLSNTTRSRTVYADRGEMAFNNARTDLFLTLHDGWIQEIDNATPERFQRVFYNDYFLRIRNVGNTLERNADSYRSDREMSIAMLAAEVKKGKEELEQVRREALVHSKKVLRQTLNGEQNLSFQPAPSMGLPANTLPSVRESIAQTQAAAATLGDGDPMARQAALEARVLKSREQGIQDRINQFAAEYHKKFSIPFACLVFVLIGAPLAVRFPRGGVGMVIALSLAIFGIYYVSLIGGESLSDKGVIQPLWGMWGANLVFLTLSIFGIVRLGYETSTTRGGGWDDLLYSVRSLFTRRRRRSA